MKTPIADFVRDYAGRDIARLHMPGHKGHGPLGCEGLDITEIKGADALYEAEGIIAASEANAASLFGTGASFYSTEGSSHVIRTMVFLAWQRRKGGRGRILAARNAHKSFIYACAAVDCDVDWLYPEAGGENSVCACQVSPQAVERALEAAAEPPFAVYVTSPDYLGNLADIGGIAAVCRRFGVPLLVDNAHGAYLHFLEKPCHPMDLGAYMCADSAHKTLPVLTGGAYLHLSARAAADCGGEAKAAMVMSGSTSPSYLILQSLDLANRYMAGPFRGRLRETVGALEAMKLRLTAAGVPLLGGEMLKLTVDAAAMGMSGHELGGLLRGRGMEPEFEDADFLVCMFTPENMPEDMEKLEKALLSAPRREPVERLRLRLAPLCKAMDIRQAVFARHETVPVEKAAGRVCGHPSASCPPAVPIAVSGELITAELIPVFKAYGQTELSVVAE